MTFNDKNIFHEKLVSLRESQPVIQLLYHYTFDLNALRGILKEQTFRMTKHSELNDPSEHEYSHDLIKERVNSNWKIKLENLGLYESFEHYFFKKSSRTTADISKILFRNTEAPKRLIA